MRCQSVGCVFVCDGNLVFVVRNGVFGHAERAFLWCQTGCMASSDSLSCIAEKAFRARGKSSERCRKAFFMTVGRLFLLFRIL